MPEEVVKNNDMEDMKVAVTALAKMMQNLATEIKEIKQGIAVPPVTTEQPITDEAPTEPEDEQENVVEEEESEYVPPNERVITDDEVVEEQDDPSEVLEEEDEVPPRRKNRVLGGEDAIDDYVDMTKKRSNPSRRVPFEIKRRKNRFNDTLTYARDEIEETPQKLIDQKKRQPKRAVVKPVKVRCGECRRVFLVDAQLAPRRLTSEDSNRYVCNDCIIGNVRRRE